MERYAYCHFCDDIRREVGNKISAMGMYMGEMFVHPIPASLPKLFVMAYCTTPLEKPFSSVAFRVTLCGAILQEVSIPSSDLKRMQDDVRTRSESHDPIREISIGIHIMLAPLDITTEGALEVIIVADGIELLAGKLRIKRAPSSEQPI